MADHHAQVLEFRDELEVLVDEEPVTPLEDVLAVEVGVGAGLDGDEREGGWAAQQGWPAGIDLRSEEPTPSLGIRGSGRQLAL